MRPALKSLITWSSVAVAAGLYSTELNSKFECFMDLKKDEKALLKELNEARAEIARLNEELKSRREDQLKKSLGSVFAAFFNDKEKLFELVLNAMSAGVWITDGEGRVIFENLAAQKIWSNLKYISTYKNNLKYDGAEEQDEYPFRYLQLAASGRSSFNEVINIETYDGQVKTINCSAVPIYDNEGKPAGSIIINQDVTEQKNAEEALYQSEKKYRQLVELSNEGIWTLDTAERTTFANTALCRMLGYMPDEVIGKTPFEFIYPDSADKLREYFDGIKKGRIKYFEFELVNKNKKTVYTGFSTTSIIDEKGKNAGIFAMVTDFTERKRLEEQIIETRKELLEKYTFHDIVGKSSYIEKMVNSMPAIAESDCSVLIEGPTGTGKNLLAKTIFNLSQRRDKNIVTVNCGAIPETLLESELFGYVKGAFTDAKTDKPGKFAMADGGVMFLDEIGEMPLQLQVKLLRVIEDKCYEPLGGVKTKNVDVRIISATNRDLIELIKIGKFREDLYYRLKVVSFKIPPLCERREDITLLIEHFIKILNKKYSKQINKLDDEVYKFFLSYDFPGNVRELQNILEYAFVFCGGGVITKGHFSEEIKSKINNFSRKKIIDNVMKTDAVNYPEVTSEIKKESLFEKSNKNIIDVRQLDSVIDEIEKNSIIEALKKCHGNRNETASLLNIPRNKLWRRMKKYDLFDLKK